MRDVRREGRPSRRVEDRGQPRWHTAKRNVEGRRVREREPRRQRQMDAFNDPPPELGQPKRRAVASDARDDLGALDEGVVGSIGHRAVPGRATYPQPGPLRALLGRHDRQLWGAAAGDAGSTELGHEEVALHIVPDVLGQPPRAVGAECFLVRDRGIDQRSSRPEP